MCHEIETREYQTTLDRILTMKDFGSKKNILAVLQGPYSFDMSPCSQKSELICGELIFENW